MFSRPLGDFEPRLERIKSDIEKRLEKEFTPSPGLEKGLDSATEPAGILIRHAKPQHIVTMRGFAIRLGFPMNAPNLVKYGGKNAFKFGTDRIIESKVAVGAVTSSGNTSGVQTIYRLDWEKSYVLDDEPAIGVASNVVTDGHPEIFV